MCGKAEDKKGKNRFAWSICKIFKRTSEELQNSVIQMAFTAVSHIR